jgi:hypothetical protein
MSKVDTSAAAPPPPASLGMGVIDALRLPPIARRLLVHRADGRVDLPASLHRLRRETAEALAVFHRSCAFRRDHAHEVSPYELAEWRDDDDRYWEEHQSLKAATEALDAAALRAARVSVEAATGDAHGHLRRLVYAAGGSTLAAELAQALTGLDPAENAEAAAALDAIVDRLACGGAPPA